jgi:hypothetical protein
MSFFEDVPDPPPVPRVLSGADLAPSSLHHAPRSWVGGHLSWHIQLIETEDIYVVLSDFSAFPSGVEFTLRTTFHPGRIRVSERPSGLGRPGWFLGAADDGRLGVGLADGRKTATGLLSRSPTQEREGPLIIPGRIGPDSIDRMSASFWLWPLPPTGPITFAAEWPYQGIDERAVTLDAHELVMASRKAEEVDERRQPRRRTYPHSGIPTSDTDGQE